MRGQSYLKALQAACDHLGDLHRPCELLAAERQALHDTQDEAILALHRDREAQT